MTYGGHTYGGSALGSTSDPTQLTDTPRVFQVVRDGDVIEDAVFDVDPVVDTANPFGDFCVVKMDDRGGNKFEQYSRGTRIDVRIAFSATSRIQRFTGYVVERRENEQSGADVLEVEAYSFDQFLRRNNVTNDQTGNTISQALADIIQADTPVNYVAGNVDVGDDQELTRGYQGEPVEKALRDFAFKSNNEDFGVNDDLEFFFRPRETEHIDRGIDNTQWFNYDIPELGKEAINEVEVWFDGGDESVIVDDGTDKLDLQDSLNLPDPGTQRAELNRPTITDISDAEDEGRKYLTFRNSTLSGTVTTFGLFDARPGDTIDITIDPRGIDSEFVIAGLEYRWGVDQTVLTIVEKRGDVDDILTELNDSVQRQEMQGANRDAPKNRITTTNATGIVGVSVNADGNTPAGDRFVNDGRRLVRDGWAGVSYSAISTITVGSDGSGLSRSNTSLVAQTNSAAASQSLPDEKSVEFSASITETGVEEIGLEAADGTLVARAVFDSPVSLNGTVTVTLDVSNDASVSRGVLTNDGQTAVRDVLASNSPAVPDAYAYGSDATPVSESDTALGNELVETSLEEILIQDADSTTQWQQIVDTSGFDTLPIEVSSGGELALQQSAFVIEGEDFTTSDSGAFSSDASYSDGQSALLSGSNTFIEWEFTNNYTIPESAFEVELRIETSDLPECTFYLDDTTIFQFPDAGQILLGWDNITGGFTGSTDWSGGDIEPGTHTIRAEFDGGTGSLDIDVLAAYDGRYSYTFDNDNGGSSGYLDGPELFPDQIIQSLTTASTRRNVTEASFDLTANDTSGDFWVELANDGSTFTRVNNSDTGSVTFAGAESGVDTNISLSRYGSRTTATPQTGYLGQAIDLWMLRANVQAVVSDNIGETLARAVVPPNTSGFVGQTVREAGMKGGTDLLTRHVLAEFDVLSDQRVSSSESSSFVGNN